MGTWHTGCTRPAHHASDLRSRDRRGSALRRRRRSNDDRLIAQTFATTATRRTHVLHPHLVAVVVILLRAPLRVRGSLRTGGLMLIEGYGYRLEAPGRALARVTLRWGDPPPGAALLEVLGTGVCHTDLGFADGEVAPRAPLPLVLGHEIVGRVLRVGSTLHEELLGRRVLAPAVSPCGACPACTRGRPTSCAKGRMPGNDADGGFATHVVVPALDLVALDPRNGPTTGPLGEAGLEAWEIAPIADAATTAYQAIVRARLVEGEVAIFIGAGGVGGFGAQLARSVGAFVIAVDVSQERLDALGPAVDEAIVAGGLDARGVRDAARARIKARGKTGVPVRVFETSGTTPGQAAAFELLDRGGSLSIVGFTREKTPVRLSNVMALDAEIYGNWGCDPALYPEVVRRVLAGTVKVRPFVERRPLDRVNEVLDELRAHRLSRRAVLVPET